MRMVWPANRTEEKKGDGSKTAPISSRMTVKSTKPSPCPPYSSGKARPNQPRSAMSFQSSGLYPRSSSMSWRTREVGQLSARNACAVCRNMSCSGLKPKSILECPPVSRKSPAALENSLLGLGIEELDTLHVEIDLNFIMHSGAHLGFHTRRKGVALVGEFQYDFRSQRLEHFHGSADGGQVGALLLRC